MPGLCRHKPGHSLGKKNKVAQNVKQKKLRGFSYSKSMANFEAFRWNFLLSTNPELVRSVGITHISRFPSPGLLGYPRRFTHIGNPSPTWVTYVG